MIDIIMVYIMYFFLSSPHDFGIFTFGSFLGHHIPALEFLKFLDFSVLVSYSHYTHFFIGNSVGPKTKQLTSNCPASNQKI